MTFGKRQLVIAALVASLGAAVYLNWQFTGTSPAVETQSEERDATHLGQTTYVNTANVVASPSNEDPEEQSSSEESSAGEDSGIFAEERRKRSISNAEAAETINEAADDPENDEDTKKEAAKAAAVLAGAIKAQGDIESMIRLRGFEDAFVVINNDSCSVAVSGGKLDEAGLISIRDIVHRQTNISYDKITITEK